MSINEQILDAWLALTSAINNEKIVASMPYNEIIICRILYQNKNQECTATDLCEMTGMLKSQMNRTLTSMEEKKVIQRVRSVVDKRRIYILLDEKHRILYEQEHERILKLVDTFINRIGLENANQALKLFEMIATIAKEEIQ